MKKKWKGLSYMIMNKNVGISSIILCSCIMEYPLLRWYERIHYEVKNDHYVYHNATTVATPNECPTSTTPENARPTMKGAMKVCEPTSGFILARVDHL